MYVISQIQRFDSHQMDPSAAMVAEVPSPVVVDSEPKVAGDSDHKVAVVDSDMKVASPVPLPVLVDS
jgi:hypothetical protein